VLPIKEQQYYVRDEPTLSVSNDGAHHRSKEERKKFKNAKLVSINSKVIEN
jgi:hypothetical protein